MYRRFRLLNSRNQILELTDKKYKVFANSPQNLGYSKTLSLLRLGDENVLTYSMVNLDTITLEALFYDDSNSDKYQKYNDFVSFISYKPIYLLYQKPNSLNWYRRKIETLSLSKTEVSTDGMMHCNYQMSPLTFWEDNEQNTIEVSSYTVGDGKVYPIEYPITYGGNSLSNISMVSLGALDSPLEITIDGTSTNPQFVLYDAQDNVYGRGRLVGTFDKVYINSKESEESIVLEYNGLVLSNPLGYQDLTVGSPSEIYVTFLKLKTGTSKMAFLLDQGFDGTVTISWRNRYVSV